MTPTPRAWLCEMVQEDDSVSTMFVEQDPAGLRFGDVGEPSPFRVTPLYDHPAIDPAVAAEREQLADDLQTARDALQRASGWLHAAYDPPKTPECIAMLAEVAAARGLGAHK